MKLSLAPIQAMTIANYRNSFARVFGNVDEYYSPFIATASTKKVGHLLFKDLIPERNDSSIKIIPQLLSNNGSDFRAFATAIADMGYNEINWNIGCPFPMVTKKKKGSGILPYPDMITQFLDTACADRSYTVTVKMRLGLDYPEEGLKVIEALNQFPLGGVIIHARTGVQMYTGNVDLNSFETMVSICKHEVTYNGDIFTNEDFKNISRRFPSVSSFMLGRGALRDPFLPSAIKGCIIPHSNRMDMIREFHEEIYNYYKSTLFGEKHLLDKMKEFWEYMSACVDKDGKLMKKIRKCHTTSNYYSVTNKVLH